MVKTKQTNKKRHWGDMKTNFCVRSLFEYWIQKNHM